MTTFNHIESTRTRHFGGWTLRPILARLKARYVIYVVIDKNRALIGAMNPKSEGSERTCMQFQGINVITGDGCSDSSTTSVATFMSFTTEIDVIMKPYYFLDNLMD